MGSSDAPTMRRRLLGTQLRRYRERAGLDTAAAGYEIRGSSSKISRMERGLVKMAKRDVEDLLTLYSVDDPVEREAVLDLLVESKAPTWWSRYNDLTPQWFQNFLGFEQSCAQVQTHEVQFVPGLLQTPDYARALIAAGHGDRHDLVERWLDLRMQRQQRVNNGELGLVAFIDSSVLLRKVGTDEIMRTQARHLAEITQQDNVAVRLVPLEVDAWIAQAAAFVLLQFSDEGIPDVVYLEHLTGATFLERPADVQAYTDVLGRLDQTALSVQETTERLRNY